MTEILRVNSTDLEQICDRFNENWLLIKFIFAEEYPNPFVVLNENIVGPKMSGNLSCFS